jgi:hypothetical protein
MSIAGMGIIGTGDTMSPMSRKSQVRGIQVLDCSSSSAF